MNILLVDNGSSLIGPLMRLAGKHVTAVNWQEIDAAHFFAADAVILSGSSVLSVVYDNRELQAEISLIKNSDKPIIGICFGAELLAYAFGGTLERMMKRQKGVVDIKAACPDPIFLGRSGFRAYESHQWHIKRVPESLHVLAESKHGIEVFRHKDRPIYGFQFHPENLADKTFGNEVFAATLSALGIIPPVL